MGLYHRRRNCYSRDRYRPLLVKAEHSARRMLRRQVKHRIECPLQAQQSVKGSHKAVVALLLENGADVNLVSANGKTLLNLARDMENDSNVRFLSEWRGLPKEISQS